MRSEGVYDALAVENANPGADGHRDGRLVDGDPRSDVTSLSRVRMVFARGKSVLPADDDA